MRAGIGENQTDWKSVSVCLSQHQNHPRLLRAYPVRPSMPPVPSHPSIHPSIHPPSTSGARPFARISAANSGFVEAAIVARLPPKRRASGSPGQPRCGQQAAIAPAPSASHNLMPRKRAWSPTLATAQKLECAVFPSGVRCACLACPALVVVVPHSCRPGRGAASPDPVGPCQEA